MAGVDETSPQAASLKAGDTFDVDHVRSTGLWPPGSESHIHSVKRFDDAVSRLATPVHPDTASCSDWTLCTHKRGASRKGPFVRTAAVRTEEEERLMTANGELWPLND